MSQLLETAPPVSTTSGLYGPGAIACWYLIIAALVVSWVYEPGTRYQPGFKAAAAFAYPAFAMAHLAWQLLNFPGDKGAYLRANLLHIIVQGHSEPPVTEEYDPPRVSESWDEPGPDMFRVFPLVVSINAALRVSESCFYLCLGGAAVLILGPLKRKRDGPAEVILILLAVGAALAILNTLQLLIVCDGLRGLWIPIESAIFRFMSLNLNGTALMVFVPVLIPLEMARKQFAAAHQEGVSILRVPERIAGYIYEYLKNFASNHSAFETLGWSILWLACGTLELFLIHYCVIRTFSLCWHLDS
ncbi:unnamed protein product [Clonostachys rosea]|uniref:Uncharacterized protein n=1 Tax=Bionectria ochroleuca TaxID=29856 RepID=A0ABY6V2R5_BIOOC|nr:unnamed protein product [Clonostachys rosea]